MTLNPGMHICTRTGWHFIIDKIEDGLVFGTVQGAEGEREQWADLAARLIDRPCDVIDLPRLPLDVHELAFARDARLIVDGHDEAAALSVELDRRHISVPFYEGLLQL